MQSLCDRAADLGILHAEEDLGLAPKTFTRKETPIFHGIDQTITDYANNRAFWITGVAKDEILTTVRNLITEYAKTHDTPYPDAKLESDIAEVLKDWLPQGTDISARARLIARVNVSDVYNYTRYEVMSTPELQGYVEAFIYSAILDNRTTPLCRSLAGRIFLREELSRMGLIPPNHFNCRSMLLPVTAMDKGWREVWERQAPLSGDQMPQDGF